MSEEEEEEVQLKKDRRDLQIRTCTPAVLRVDRRHAYRLMRQCERLAEKHAVVKSALAASLSFELVGLGHTSCIFELAHKTK
ncbi:hypothetical protein AOLI_G00073600 [Acnodon oligacanthus]